MDYPKKWKFVKKSPRVVTVSVKSICYNGPENMKSATLPADKSAIRNPKSEMEGPYLSNSCAMVLSEKYPASPLKNGIFDKYPVSSIQNPAPSFH